MRTFILSFTVALIVGIILMIRYLDIKPENKEVKKVDSKKVVKTYPKKNKKIKKYSNIVRIVKKKQKKTPEKKHKWPTVEEYKAKGYRKDQMYIFVKAEIGMTEAELKSLINYGVHGCGDDERYDGYGPYSYDGKTNVTRTAYGTRKQYILKKLPSNDRIYVYTENGIVTTIQE